MSTFDINQLVMKSIMESDDNQEPEHVNEDYDALKNAGRIDGTIVGKAKRGYDVAAEKVKDTWDDTKSAVKGGWDAYTDSAKDAYHDQQPGTVEKIKDAVGDNKAAAATAGAIGAGLGGVALAKKLRNRKKNK